MSEPLSAKERNRYAICKKQIQEGLQTCFDTGFALIEVRDYRLYREDFDNFVEFCNQTYHIGESQAYRLIDAAEVKESLPPATAKLITNEAQARALVDVPENKRAAVVQKLARSGEPITAANIRAVAPEPKTSPIGGTLSSSKHDTSSNRPSQNGEHKGSQKIIELDEVGTMIPEDALPYWARRQEIQDLLTQIIKIKSAVVKAKEENDPMFGKVSNSAISDLTQAYTHLLEGKPYAVCTTCMGSFTLQPKGCSFCGNKGLISKWQWDTQSRKEVKEMRVKANSKK